MGSLRLRGLKAPAPLSADHASGDFTCTEPALEVWLKQRARRNQLDHASRCFVIVSGSDVIGYYALSAGAISHEQATGSTRRNMPDPIPVVVLGRLAVHSDWAGQGVGAGLLKDAVLRASRLSQELGIRALLCHALNEEAKRFYLHHGFVISPIEPLTVMLNLAKLSQTVSS